MHGNHAPVTLHLPPRQGVLWVRSKPRVPHAGNPRLRLQPFGQSERIVAMALHPQSERLYAAQHQEAVKGARNAPHRILQECELLAPWSLPPFVAHDRDAADHVRVAVQIFGRRMHDDVKAEFERPLHRRSGKRVIGHCNEVMFARDPRQRAQIGKLEQRIAGRFDPQHPGLRPNGGSYGVQVG